MILTANLVKLQMTIRKKNVVPCPKTKRGNVTHALSEAGW